jgi:hypothetical protein
MITTKQARKILSKDYAHLTDAEIDSITKVLTQLAEIEYDMIMRDIESGKKEISSEKGLPIDTK